MVMAADLAVRSGRLDPPSAKRIKTLLERFGLPVSPPELSGADLLAAMGMDKKVVDGTLRLVLSTAIGSAFVTTDVDQAALAATLAARELLHDG